MEGGHQATREDRGSVPLTPACTHSAAVAPGFLAGPDPWLCLPRDSLSWHQPGPFLLTSPAHWHLLADPPGWHPPGWDLSILLSVNGSSYLPLNKTTWQLLSATQVLDPQPLNHLRAPLWLSGGVSLCPQNPGVLQLQREQDSSCTLGSEGLHTSACLLDVVTIVRTSPGWWRWGMTGPMAPAERQPTPPTLHTREPPTLQRAADTRGPR